MVTSTTADLAATALALAARGLAVFPLQPRGKEPATANGLRDATRDPYQIESWWSSGFSLNIGVATGRPSNGIWVLDIDGLDGEASLRSLEDTCGALPRTVESITGKGRHLYFKSNKPIKNSASAVGQHIDVRGDGGYVVAPPSMHPTGRRYAWSVDTANEFATAPEWLVDLAAKSGTNKVGKPLEHWHSELTRVIQSGERNVALAAICGKLLHSGLNDAILLFDVMMCINIARCAQPLCEREIETIVSSVVQTHLRKRMS